MKAITPPLTGILSLLIFSFATLAEPSLPLENVRPAWLGTPYPDAGPFVAWQPCAGADSYHLYRADDVNATWTVVATNLAVPFYLDSYFSFLPSYYVVVAVNADGLSEASAPVTVTEQYGGTISALEVRLDWGTLTPTNARVEWSTSWSGGDEGIVEWGPAMGVETNYTSYLLNTNYLTYQRFLLTNLLPLTEYNYRATSISGTRGGVRWTGSFITPDLNHPPVADYSLLWDGYGTNLLFQLTLIDSDPRICCPYPTNSARVTVAPTNGSVTYFSQIWGEANKWYLTYVPDARARGEDRFSLVVNDGELDSAPVTIVVSNWMNTVPTASWVTVQGVEDTPLNFTLNDFDPDGDPVTFNFPWLSGGTLSGVPPNFTFTPNPNVNGEGWVNYEVTDGYGTNYGSLQIQLAPVNDRPVVDPLFATLYEDYSTYLYPWFLDADGSGSYITEIESQPAHGSVTTFGFEMIYTPAPDFFGTDTFTFAVVELNGTRSDPATATMTVIPLNDYVVPQSQNFLIPENSSVNFVLSATDPDGDVLTYWINSGPFNGALSGTAPNFTYTPNSNFFGHETISFSVTDGYESRPGTITISVGANSLPQPLLRRRTFGDGIVHLWWSGVTGAQYFNVYRADGSNGPFTLLAGQVVSTNFDDTTAQWQHPYWYYVRSWDGTNEGQRSNPLFTYPDSTGVLALDQQNWLIRGNTGRVSFYSSIIGGTEGIFEYGTNRDYGVFLENTNILPFQVFSLTGLTPTTIYYFRVTATDANGNAIVVSTNYFQDWFATESRPIANAQAVSGPEDTQLNITVDPINDAPLAFNQSRVLGEDTQTNLTLQAADAEGGPVIFQVLAPPAHGTLSGALPFVTYRPATNYFGADSFTYTVVDPQFASGTGTVTLTITNINDRPIPTPQSLTTAEDAPLLVNVSGTDVDGDPLTLLILVLPTHGTLSALTPTNVLYTPETNYNGPDSFTFRVSDGKLTSLISSTNTITVTPVNDAPVANPQSVSTAEDTAKAILLTGTDVDGSALTYAIVSGPAHGTLSGTGANRTYTPAPNYFGADAFSFSVSDGTATSAPATLTITVTPVNDVPIANAQSVTVAEDGSVVITPGGSDADLEGLTFVMVTAPAHGGVIALGPTSWGYTPSANYHGSDSFTFVARDAVTSSAPATISITVLPVNNAPTANPQSVSTAEDNAVEITLTAGDVDNDVLTYSVVATPVHGTLSGVGGNLTYTPEPNFHGADSFTFAASDPTQSDVATVTIVVTPVNDPPMANPQFFNVDEDTFVAITLTGSDVDEDTLTFTLVTAPVHGMLSGTIPNFTYTPDANFYGADSFSFKVNDGSVDGNTASISITVHSVNDVPTASNLTATTEEDVPVTIAPLGVDPDGDVPQFTLADPGPQFGSVIFDGTNFVYIPTADFVGNDVFHYAPFDGAVTGAVATVILTVSPVNDEPVVHDLSVVVVEDGSTNINLVALDVDGDALSVAAGNGPAHGTLSGSGASLTYTPYPDFHGNDSFTYTANDGVTDSALATVNIFVTAVNDLPVAIQQNISLDEDTSRALMLAGTDVDGDSLSFALVSGPAHGTLSGQAPNLTYLPHANYHGSDSFTFVVHDGTGSSVPAAVSLNVIAVNDAPVTSARSAVLMEDFPTAVTLVASDLDGDLLTFSIVNAPAHGTLTGSGTNRTYTPAANYYGTDSFVYRATDPAGASSDSVFSLTITPANDRPVGVDQTAGVIEETPLWFVPDATDADGDVIGFEILQPMKGTAVVTNGGILYTPNSNYFGNDILYYWPNDGSRTGALTVIVFNITNVNDAPMANNGTATTAEDTAVNITLTGIDPDADPLAFTVVSGPSHGTLTGTSATRTYTPAANYNGPDSFSFVANDGTTNTAAATVNITVTPVNDVPSIMSYSTVTDEDTPVSFTLSAADVDNDPLTFIVLSNPSHGTLSGTAPGLTYTPAANYVGSDTFTFRVNDGTVNSGMAMANFTIRAINDQPIANAQTVEANEDTSVLITLTGSDVDGDGLSYTVLSNPAHGTLSGTPINISSTNANFTYTPAANYNGPDSFNFKVHDGRTNSVTATVMINIAAVNDAPVANAQSVTVTYNTAKPITLTGSDIEGSALSYSFPSLPTNGSLTGSGAAVTYTPNVGSAGADTFTFRVHDGSSLSAPATVSIATQNPVSTPGAPSGLTVTVPSTSGTLILSWNDNSTNEDGFKIERSPTANNNWAQIATVGINLRNYTNSGLANKTTFYYRVSAYNRLGDSAYSNTVNGKTR